MHGQVEGPSGGSHVIAATQEGSHCLQDILEPAQLHLLPGLQAHEGLVLGEATHQGGHLIQEGFSRQPWAEVRVQDLQNRAAVH